MMVRQMLLSRREQLPLSIAHELRPALAAGNSARPVLGV